MKSRTAGLQKGAAKPGIGKKGVSGQARKSAVLKCSGVLWPLFSCKGLLGLVGWLGKVPDPKDDFPDLVRRECSCERGHGGVADSPADDGVQLPITVLVGFFDQGRDRRVKLDAVFTQARSFPAVAEGASVFVKVAALFQIGLVGRNRIADVRSARMRHA